MKAIALNGSPRKNGNTEILCNHALKAIAEEGIETEIIRIADYNIKPCTGCDGCVKTERCVLEDDLFPIYLKMKAADAIILASPVYFGSATAQTKALMDRTGYIGYWNRVFERKVGGALVVARRAGVNFTFAQLNYWFQISGFIVPGSTYWNIAYGQKLGDVVRDEEGMKTTWNFGKNVAYLVNKLGA